MTRAALPLALALLLWPLASAEAADGMAVTLQQVKARAMRPLPRLPAPAQPREEWVSERRVWLPGLGVFAVVPGHWERRLTETQSAVPPLTVFREGGHAPLAVPAGERLPADLRSAP